VLTDGSHTYAWDAYSNSIALDGVGLTFDALDRMVEQNRSGTYTEIVYSPGGAKLALMSGTGGQTLQKAFVPLPGQAIAVYTSGGLDHYRHSDWLGSARLTSSPSRTVLSTTAYAPFGETYAQSGTLDLSFTGQNPDTVSGDYDFLFREYSTQGRWSKPDPAGLASVDPANPQSFNRYAYVRNSPLNLIDPLGLNCVWDDGSFDAEDDASTNTATLCEDAGGTWFANITGDWNPNPNDYLAGIIQGLQDFANRGACPGICVTSQDNSLQGSILDQMRNPSLCPTCLPTLNSASDWVTAGAIYTGAGIVTVVAAPVVVESAAGDFLFSRGTGLLNSNNYVRIGWGWYGGNIIDYVPVGAEVFRIVVGNPNSPIHWHLWP
jgi:RHS repeat-associated protein